MGDQIKVPVIDAKGKKVGTEDLSIKDFKHIKFASTAHQTVKTLLAAKRRGTHDTKTRGEVSGGGQKPWRQKGTGRARIGSTRAPHWTGGGVVFGPQPRDHSLKMPKKMKKRVLAEALVIKASDGKINLFSETGIKNGKTSEGVKFIDSLKMDGNILMILRSDAEMERRAFSNLSRIRVLSVNELNVYELMWCDNILVEKEQLEQVKGLIA